MIVAREKKQSNIVEYLLYMWQVEDLIRANELDMVEIKKNIISQYRQPEDTQIEIYQWWENLTEMMKLENKQKSGHLQINTNLINDLNRLHLELLNSDKEIAYRHIYNATLPYIQDFIKKTNKENHEVEVCMTAIYGSFMLKLQGKTISKETEEAIKAFGKFLALLSGKYKEEQEEDKKSDEISYS